MPSKVAIIDYGVGNLGAIHNMLSRIDSHVVISAVPQVLATARALILPGVGAFDAGIQRLNESGLVPLLNELVIEKKKPILGICLGMQIFCASSEEGKLPGLGWLDATVRRFDAAKLPSEAKVPHMGWNYVSLTQPHGLTRGFSDETKFYFVHSYHLECAKSSDVIAVANYHYDFPAAIARENIWGTQFHPEKSHRFGLQLMENFLKIV